MSQLFVLIMNLVKYNAKFTLKPIWQDKPRFLRGRQR